MSKIPKARALLGSLIAVVALMAVAVLPVMAQVPVFSPFTGSVTIDDALAPVDSEVRAFVDGELAELLPPAELYSYTVTTLGQYELVIKTDAKDQAVTFEVKKAGTAVWVPATSTPAAPVTTYQTQNVDLVAYTGVVYYTLTVNVSPVGSGTVTKSPDLAQYAAGTTVGLTANPASGYTFDEWSGTNNNAINPTTVTMDSAKIVTANFVEEVVTEYEYPSFSDWLDWWAD